MFVGYGVFTFGCAKKNGQANPLIDRVFKTEINRLNYTKAYGPEKCPVLLILPYVGEKLTQIERS